MKSKLFLISLAAVILSFSPTGYKIGDQVKDFSLKNVDGKMVSMSHYKDAKGYIVVFTCNHCPFAKAYESRIMALDKKFASKGYPVLAINPNDPNTVEEDSYDNMVARAKEKNYSFPYLIDETQDVAHAFGATRTPHVFIVQKENGKNILKYIGAIDNNSEDEKSANLHYVEDAVNALLSNKPVTTTETKAIGCTIKWKS
jgi:glutathione peroxidase-family protein